MQSFRSPPFSIARHVKRSLIFCLLYRAISTFRASLVIEVKRKSLSIVSHIYPLFTVCSSYLTIVFNQIIWNWMYFNSLKLHSFGPFSPFVPLRQPLFAQVWGSFKSKNALSFRSPPFPIALHSKQSLIFRLFYCITSTFCLPSAIEVNRKVVTHLKSYLSFAYRLLIIFDNSS
jgi:hypothetical protein